MTTLIVIRFNWFKQKQIHCQALGRPLGVLLRRERKDCMNQEGSKLWKVNKKIKRKKLYATPIMPFMSFHILNRRIVRYVSSPNYMQKTGAGMETWSLSPGLSLTPPHTGLVQFMNKTHTQVLVIVILQSSLITYFLNLHRICFSCIFLITAFSVACWQGQQSWLIQ